MESPPPIKRFSPGRLDPLLSAGNWNRIIDAASKTINVEYPLTIREAGAMVMLGVDEYDGWGLAEIVSDTAYSDARYKFKLREPSNADADAASNLGLAYDLFPDSDVRTATNLAEWSATYSDQTHVLSDGRQFIVFRKQDKGAPPSWRWVFDIDDAQNSLCESSDYAPGGSDVAASDLAAGDHASPKGVDWTGTYSDTTHGYVTGHMYEDSDGKWNPWIAVDPTKIFCSDSVFVHPAASDWSGNVYDDGTSKHSDLGRPANPVASWMACGHMYEDSDGKWNPWINLNLERTHLTFGVRIQKVSGSAGNFLSEASFGYNGWSLATNALLLSDAQPLRPRPAMMMKAQTGSDGFGLAFYDAALAVKLWDAGEVPVTSDCT